MVVQELQGVGIENALQGHTNARVNAQVDPNTGRTTKVWITFSDPAVLELEAAIVDGEPALLGRLHYRQGHRSPI